MIRVINADKIDPAKWDYCVTSSPNGNIYGLYSSLNAGCKSWKGIIYGDYEAVLALPIKKKFMLSYSWHPQFMGPLGIYGKVLTPEITDGFFKAVLSNSWWIRMYYFQKTDATKCSFIPRVHQMLDVENLSIETVRKLYNENTRRNIKKTQQFQFEIKPDTDINSFIGFFKKNKGEEIDTLKESSYVQLSKLMKLWLGKGNGYIRSGYVNNELHAMAYFILWNGVLTYYKGFSTEAGKKNGSMHFLLDREIESNLARIHKVDFGGSNVESVARFYKGFGGADETYYQAESRKF